MSTIYNSTNNFKEEINEDIIHEFENFVWHVAIVFNPCF
jgi:hypothetical protein